MDLFNDSRPEPGKGFAGFASSWDRFGESFAFKLPGNKWKHGSKLGFMFTLLMVSILIFQAHLKLVRVFGFGDTKIIQTH